MKLVREMESGSELYESARQSVSSCNNGRCKQSQFNSNRQVPSRDDANDWDPDRAFIHDWNNARPANSSRADTKSNYNFPRHKKRENKY